MYSGNERIMETERGSTRSHSAEKSLRKRPWTCRKTDYRMNDVTLFVKTSRLALGVSYLISSRVLSQGLSGRDVNLTTHVHIVPRLRMIGNMALLFLQALMA
jgi:hypothetical protein